MTPPLPPGPYGCIVADPAWEYRNRKTGGTMKSGAAAHYPTMTVEEIAALPVRDLRHPAGTVCFLWTTAPLLSEAFGVLAAWGFQYKTTLIWAKTRHNGMGFWFRGNAEFCLLGVTKGVKAFRCQKPNVIHAHPTGHSAKPAAFWELIEPILDAYRIAPRLELFARTRRDGWDAWGDEVV